MKQKVQHLEKRLFLGVVSLGIGLFAANLAFFNWVERTSLAYLLGGYARYVCAYGGFGGMIFGSMLVNDFFTARKYLQRKRPKEAVTLFVDTTRKKESQPVNRRTRKKTTKMPSRA